MGWLCRGKVAQTHETVDPGKGRRHVNTRRMGISTALSVLLVGAGGEGVSAAPVSFESASGGVGAAVQGVSELAAETTRKRADDAGADKSECSSYDDDGLYTNITCAAADSLACRYV